MKCPDRFPLARLALLSLLPLLGALALGGCDEQEPEPPGMTAAPEADGGPGAAAPTRAASAATPRPQEEGQAPIEVTADAIAVGSAIAGNGAIQAPGLTFATSDTVYVSIPTAGHAPGDTVRVYWTNASGLSDKQETQVIAPGQEHVTFAFAQPDGMAAGNYNVQVDVNEIPVGIVDFNVN